MTQPIGKAARNKQRELFATTVNAAGLAVFAIGGLTPALQGGVTTTEVAAFWASSAVGFVPHLAAQAILRGLEE